MGERPTPGGEINRDILWESRVDQATMKEVGVRDPEGNFHRFNNDEKFTLVGESGSRQPFIIEQDGTQIPFQEWKDKQPH